MKSSADAFITTNQTTEIIHPPGCKAMTALFGGSSTGSLTRLRYKVFSKKVITASSFVSAQIKAWMEKEGGLDSLKWGWKLEDNQYIPVMTRNGAPVY